MPNAWRRPPGPAEVAMALKAPIGAGDDDLDLG
jgi:hypothetical protein